MKTAIVIDGLVPEETRIPKDRLTDGTPIAAHDAVIFHTGALL